jgi:polyisoprenoid-binding protein YceI
VTLPIAPGTYGIDTSHSQLGFAVRHLGISVIRGTFDRYAGALYVGDDLPTTVVTIEAEMASINSGNRDRDEHMHAADWFDVATYPQMSFRSSAMVEAADGYTMTGDLTIKGIAQSVTFDVAYNGSNTFPVDQSTHFGFEATGAIRRSAFGISYGLPLLSDEVRLTLGVQFVQPQVDR